MDSDRPITRLLQEWQGGNAQALERLIPLVYDELHALASRYLVGERVDHTLQTTALINEAYLRLDGRAKRGGGVPHLVLGDVDPPSAAAPVDAADVYALDQALSRLEALDPQQGRIVELRYFGGMTIEETAAVMGSSTATVKRDWAVARAWLYRELTGDPTT